MSLCVPLGILLLNDFCTLVIQVWKAVIDYLHSSAMILKGASLNIIFFKGLRFPGLSFPSLSFLGLSFPGLSSPGLRS